MFTSSANLLSSSFISTKYNCEQGHCTFALWILTEYENNVNGVNPKSCQTPKTVYCCASNIKLSCRAA